MRIPIHTIILCWSLSLLLLSWQKIRIKVVYYVLEPINCALVLRNSHASCLPSVQNFYFTIVLAHAAQKKVFVQKCSGHYCSLSGLPPILQKSSKEWIDDSVWGNFFSLDLIMLFIPFQVFLLRWKVILISIVWWRCTCIPLVFSRYWCPYLVLLPRHLLSSSVPVSQIISLASWSFTYAWYSEVIANVFWIHTVHVCWILLLWRKKRRTSRSKS